MQPATTSAVRWLRPRHYRIPSVQLDCVHWHHTLEGFRWCAAGSAGSVASALSRVGRFHWSVLRGHDWLFRLALAPPPLAQPAALTGSLSAGAKHNPGAFDSQLTSGKTHNRALLRQAFDAHGSSLALTTVTIDRTHCTYGHCRPHASATGGEEHSTRARLGTAGWCSDTQPRRAVPLR